MGITLNITINRTVILKQSFPQLIQTKKRVWCENGIYSVISHHITISIKTDTENELKQVKTGILSAQNPYILLSVIQAFAQMPLRPWWWSELWILNVRPVTTCSAYSLRFSWSNVWRISLRIYAKITGNQRSHQNDSSFVKRFQSCCWISSSIVEFIHSNQTANTLIGLICTVSINLSVIAQ